MDHFPAAATPEEVKAGRVLRERYLVLYIMTPSEYKARLLKQAHGVSVPPIRGVPVLLDVWELASEEDNDFMLWVHRARRLSSVNALRASADKAYVCPEQKFRYAFDKLRTKGQLRAMFRTHYAASVPIAANLHLASAVDPPAAPLLGRSVKGRKLTPTMAPKSIYGI